MIYTKIIKSTSKYTTRKYIIKHVQKNTLIKMEEVSKEVEEWLKEDLPRSTEDQSLPMPWTDEYNNITNTNY